MKNKFFCPFPWNHLMFKSNGRVQACCETYEHQFDPGGATIAEIANHPIIKQLRLDILDPDKVPGMCWKCENREQVLGTSVRMNTALMHKHWDEESAKQATNADGSMDNFHLEHLDIRWSNLCNYKCRFCHLGSSNLWLKETQMLGQYVSDAYNPKTGIAEYDMDWEDLKTHLPYVRYVKLAGGEPAIMPGTYQLLEELIRIGNTKKAKLTLITNATTLQYGKYDLIGLMSEFDICKVQMSMEGMGIRHEWARSGKKDWDTIAENIQQFEKWSNVTYDKLNQNNDSNTRKLNFHTGISWMNMYHLADFVLAYPNIKFVFNLVTQPKEMSMLHFDVKELKRCSDYYTELLQTVHTPMVTDHLQQLKNAIDNSIKKTDQSGNVNNFRMMQDKLDHFRNQSFTTAYPEWAHLYA
jgi:organic radical activating enzyme